MSSKTTPKTQQTESGARSFSDSSEVSVITGATIAMSSVGVVFIVGYVWLGASLLAWTVASGILLGLLCLALLRLTRRATLFGNIATAVLAAVLLVVALRSGGLESTGFSWLLLLPVIAAFGVGLRAAWVWLGVVWISALCFWVFDASAMVVIPVEHATLNSLFNRLGVSLSLAVVTTVFIKALRRIEDRLSRANLLLEDEVRSRRQMEAELRESQERSRDLVENSPMMLYTHDLEGNILSANRALVEFLGCRHESDLVGKSGITLLAPEVRSESEEYLVRVRRERSACGLARVVTPDGKSKLLEYHNTLKVDGAHGPVVRGVARDVTEQEQARRALLRQVEQEELVSGIATRFISVDGSELPPAIETGLGELAGFAEVDRATLYLLAEHGGKIAGAYGWADANRQSAGRDPVGDSLDRYPWISKRLRGLETIIVHDVEDAEVDAATELYDLLGRGIRSALLVPLVGRDGLLGMLALSTSSRPRRWLQENLVLAYISGYVFTSAILRVRNEEKTLRLENEIQQARRMESLGLVAGGIAHDFNNLLMGILGNAGLVQMHLPEGSEGVATVRQITESARQAAELTSQMLSYSGSANLVPEVVDLDALVSESVAGLRPDEVAGVDIDMWLHRSLPPVEVDSGQIRQVLRNLVENSVESMGGKAGKIQIRTGLVDACEDQAPNVFRPLKQAPRAGLHVFVQVTDWGCGIGADALPRIFDPFFSTRFTGRGLGLAAVHGIVKAHHGVIDVMSEIGRGTTVRIFFPVAATVEQSAEAGRDVEEEKADRGSILVVDDEESILTVVTRMLEISGFKVVAVSNEEQALETVRHGPRDVRAMLFDFSLPHGDVAETLRELRTTGLEAPVIMMSGFSSEQVRERLAGENIAGFLEKPFGSQILLSELERVLEQ